MVSSKWFILARLPFAKIMLKPEKRMDIILFCIIPSGLWLCGLLPAPSSLLTVTGPSFPTISVSQIPPVLFLSWQTGADHYWTLSALMISNRSVVCGLYTLPGGLLHFAMHHSNVLYIQQTALNKYIEINEC